MKKLLILSGKGGTGKTSVAAAFVTFSKARAIADCDVDAPNLHLTLSLPLSAKTMPFYGSRKAYIDPAVCTLCGKCLSVCRFGAVKQNKNTYTADPIQCEGCGVCQLVCPEKAITLRDDISGEQSLYQDSSRTFSTAALKMGRGNSGKLVTAVKKNLFEHCNKEELAIIDGSPGIGCPVIASVNGMDLILVVAEPSCSGFNDLVRLTETARSLQAPLCVCVNKWDLNPDYTCKIQKFCIKQNIPYLGNIPFDETVSTAINLNRSIAEYSCAASQALFEIYQNTMELLEKRHETISIN